MEPIQETTSSDLLHRMLDEDQSLRAFIRSLVPDVHDAEDLQQEVWKTLCVKMDHYDPSRPLRPWIMGIARIHVLRWRQTHYRNREYSSEELLEKLADEAEELQEELEVRKEYLTKCVKHLPAQQQKILGWIYRERHSQKDVASKLKRSVGSLQMQLTRIRRGLRNCIESRICREEVT